MTRLRYVLAFVAVAGGLLAASSLYKEQTCACSGGLPFGAIALWSGVSAGVALGMYVALGVALRGE
ncbi:MAG TPA: hypothetical protein VET66_13200 [Steroidobacteraceae bacterium]|nr:hypothetical protein [Dehalococcoidia bacterium]HYM29101.1 hypothetical protein [Steroidobacteraceae bacterium]